jgi:hypothetical protein
MSEVKTGQIINHIQDTPDRVISLEDGSERHEYSTPSKQFSLESAAKPGEVVLVAEDSTDKPGEQICYLLSGNCIIRVDEKALKDESGNYLQNDIPAVELQLRGTENLTVGEPFPLSGQKKSGKILRALTSNGNIFGGANPDGEPMESDPVRYFVNELARRNKAIHGDRLGLQSQRDKIHHTMTALIERYS